jgi:cytidylate kinase
MIITIGGTGGSGKTTVGKEVARKLGYKHYSTGQMMREMAEERKISLLELSKLAETDTTIDQELDQRQIDLGRNEDNFVIDGRLSFHFIPNAVKIFLDADFDVRAKRIFHDTIRNEHNVSLETSKEKLKKREESERKRYMEYYNLDPSDHKHYDLVIDTSKIAVDEIVGKIIGFLEKK